MQEVTFVARDPKKPDEPEERGRQHTCHRDTDGERDSCLQSHRSGCGQRCCGRYHGDNHVSVGSSCGKTCGDTCVEETSRGLDRNDHVTKTRMSRSLREYGKKCQTTDAGSLDDRRNTFQLIHIIVRLKQVHFKAVLEGRGQGWLFCERAHQRWTRAQDTK